ncbi:MAG TPA: cytochrome P450 [Opitutaceae bacterium]|nr:cytochrome P450 [Opitutaceae bacterium]
MSCPFHDKQPDPFSEPRRKDGVLINPFQGTPIPMLLRHDEVRRAAKDWETFSSDAPFRIPIPSEESVRTVRQLPLEIDPPEHSDYRDIVEPFFNRARLPEVIAQVEGLVGTLVTQAVARDSIEIVREFAIPLQSRALACLVNLPQSEADVWISWGMHIFREGDGTSKGAALETYTQGLLDRAAAAPGDDLFSALTQARFRGRPLTREEMLGFCNIVFAGGRDTIINSIAFVIGHLSAHPSDFAFLREDPKRIIGASEEFFRVLSPSTHLARLCKRDTELHGVPVRAGDLISLNFAAANYDESVFDQPEKIQLDRRPNPHVAFGFGPHLCLGAAHARLVVRSLLKLLCEKVDCIETLATVDRYEVEATYKRRVAYEKLSVRLSPLSAT